MGTVALYMRLSNEDTKAGESDSIKNQRDLLRGFLESRREFDGCTVMEFCDDGYTGTNFNRPGAMAMLRKAREEALSCIVVKDFSRFSRDYIDLGTYLDQIFPFMGIRFISVNDDYDSSRCCGTGQIEFSFQSLLYDLYSKDLSLKVKSSLEAKKKAGQFVSANPPFGYRKDSGDRHSLVIKEEEAQIVRRIFALREKGMTSVQIAGLLNREKVKTPAAFRKEEGCFYRTPRDGKFLWSSPAVCHILENQVYAGDMVYGKYYKEEVGGRNRIRPREEWRVYPEHHKPIVSREIFFRVQKKGGGKKKKGSGERHPLTGSLICAGCGRNLRIRRGGHFYFCCEGGYGEGGEGCVRRLDGSRTEEYILEKIRERALEQCDRDAAWKEREKTLTGQLADRKRKRERTKRELAGIKREKLAEYEGFAGGWKSGEELKEQHRVLDLRARELERELAEAEKGMREVQKELEAEKGLPVLLAFLGLAVLTKELVRKWIREIVAGDDRLEIRWREPGL